MSRTDRSTAVRWRLALGRHAENALGEAGLSETDGRLDQAMEALYGRAHAERGYRGRGGSLDLSKIVLPRWLDTLKELSPRASSRPSRAMRSSGSTWARCCPIPPRSRSLSRTSTC